MANLITAGRIVLLFVAVGMIYTDSYWWIFIAGWLLAIVFAADAIDGWVARRRDSTSDFGAVIDIAGDRIVENVLWVVFAHLQVIPIWASLVVLTRSFLVDVVRTDLLARGVTPFGEKTMMRSKFTHFLTAGRFSRAYYGWSKALAFVFLSWLYAWQLEPDRFLDAIYGVDLARGIVWFIVYSSVAICVIRGLPVLYDALYYYRNGGEPARLEPRDERPPAVTSEQTEHGRSIS